MGLTSTSPKEMYFDNCRVPAKNLIGNEGEGIPMIGKSLVGWGFFGAAGISAGIARSATEIAVKHAKERTIGGQPIGIHQAVQAIITDMNCLAFFCDKYSRQSPNHRPNARGVYNNDDK